MDAILMVGNSRCALNGDEWVAFVAEVRDLLAQYQPRVFLHREWHSRADSALANVVWYVELDGSMAVLRDELTSLARRYGNPSVAWLQGAIESVAV